MINDYKYKSFEDWFNEIENYGTRGERSYWELDKADPETIHKWLKACWECARMTEQQESARERFERECG
jgi:hypothetical protein